jgi:ABC-type branched-subunit amino acid transport system substrate-binding protein
MTRGKYLGLVFLLVLGLAFAGCAQKEQPATEGVQEPAGEQPAAAEAPEEIAIGVLMPLSGNLAPFGEGMVKGARVAEAEINEKGGVLGAKVKLIIEDTATDPAKAAEAGNKLINVNGVQAIVGAAASSSTLAVAPTAEQNHVVLISPASTSPAVTDAGDYIFRVVASDDLQGKVMSDLTLQQGYKKAAVLVVNNDYGIAFEKVFKENFEAGGGSVVATVEFDENKGDYRTELGMIKDSGADMIMFVGYPQDGSVLIKQAAELGITLPWISAEGIASEEMFDYPGLSELMEGMLLTKPAPQDQDSPEYKNFLDRFKAMYPGEEPGIYADTTYDATMMVAAAMEAAGANDGEKIKDALYDLSKGYKGATGDKTMDEKGDIMYQDYVILKATGGTFETVGTWVQGTLEMSE